MLMRKPCFRNILIQVFAVVLGMKVFELQVQEQVFEASNKLDNSNELDCSSYAIFQVSCTNYYYFPKCFHCLHLLVEDSNLTNLMINM